MRNFSEQRKEALAKLEAKQADIHAEFRKDCLNDDAAHAASWDEVRARYEADMRRF